MPEKILVIDDDADVLETTSDTLKYDGYEVVTATDGESGLKMLRKEKPGLVILDIMMPGGMSGYSVCEKIKGDPSTRNIPVLILTAKNVMRDLELALEKGADWYISKPYDIKYLLRNVKRLIDRAKANNADKTLPPQVIKNSRDKKKILVIDDDKDVVGTTKDTLEFDGYEVICAYNGTAGLELCKKEKPDLVILDIMMPGEMDGYGVCGRIKSDPALKQIPILMLTAKDIWEDIEKALEKGANWYITKPYDIDYLLRNVKKLLERSQM